MYIFNCASSVIVQYLYSFFFSVPRLETLILNYTKYTLYLFVVVSVAVNTCTPTTAATSAAVVVVVVTAADAADISTINSVAAANDGFLNGTSAGGTERE